MISWTVEFKSALSSDSFKTIVTSSCTSMKPCNIVCVENEKKRLEPRSCSVKGARDTNITCANFN